MSRTGNDGNYGIIFGVENSFDYLQFATGVRFSVVIPVFGSTPHLAACRAALGAQTVRDFEVVECGPVADGPQNAGAARNAGLDRATGEWIAFVDADDLPMPEMLETAVDAGERACADVVVFDAAEFDDKTGLETPLPLKLGAGLDDDVRFTSFGNSVWNKLFRASYLKEQGIRFQEIERSNDLAFCIEALARTDRMAVVPRVLYRYRINGGGLQSTKSASPDCWRVALAEVRSRLERAGLLPRFAVALKRLARQVEGDNLPGGRFSPRKILHSVRRRGLASFLKHAYGRLLR